jgi:MoxR-like ATPase
VKEKNMHLINIPQMQQVVEHVVIGENEPAWFHGEPGCGKSQGIDRRPASRARRQLIDFRLGQYDTVDFKGFPDIDRETNTTVWHMASTLPFVGNPKFDPDRKKLVFLDEADHGKDSVKGVAYQLLQERRVGEHIIQPNTYFCRGRQPAEGPRRGRQEPAAAQQPVHAL